MHAVVSWLRAGGQARGEGSLAAAAEEPTLERPAPRWPYGTLPRQSWYRVGDRDEAGGVAEPLEPRWLEGADCFDAQNKMRRN